MGMVAHLLEVRANLLLIFIHRGWPIRMNHVVKQYEVILELKWGGGGEVRWESDGEAGPAGPS